MTLKQYLLTSDHHYITSHLIMDFYTSVPTKVTVSPQFQTFFFL